MACLINLALVGDLQTKVIVFEDLKTKKLTKAQASKKQRTRQSKANLNRSILDKGWHQLEIYVAYKAQEADKACFKVPAHYTSQECADCGHTHPNNRKNQECFVCVCCGHSDNADRNAAKVIKQRAIKRILDSGTELSKRAVLLDTGRGAAHKTPRAIANGARSHEASKKKKLALLANFGSSLL